MIDFRRLEAEVYQLRRTNAELWRDLVAALARIRELEGAGKSKG